MNVKNRTLFIADNLEIMRGIDSETIDLIYLDPPFNTKKNYKAPIGSPAEGAEFKDIWTDADVKNEWHGQIAEQYEDLYQAIQATETIYDTSMKIYLMAMTVRLFEMKRLLKQTGSIYLHCDPTASHYLKMCMDSIFGKQNFRNEIVWHYSDGTAPKLDFKRKHDIVLRYSKANTYIYNRDVVKIPVRNITRYNKTDKDRRKYFEDKRRYNPPRRYYADKGIDCEDVWSFLDNKELRQLNSMSKERTGYPTQKPLALLRRIIQASSNENDVVLDPFCGCATACVAAEELQRQWIGIDISPSAETITKLRLEEASEQGKLFSPIKMSDVHVLKKPPPRTDIPKTPHPKTYKHELYGEQEGRCAGCQYFLPFRNLTIDHIVPRAAGGSNRKENIQLLCSACNSTKGTKSQAEFIEILENRNIRQLKTDN